MTTVSAEVSTLEAVAPPTVPFAPARGVAVGSAASRSCVALGAALAPGLAAAKTLAEGFGVAVGSAAMVGVAVTMVSVGVLFLSPEPEKTADTSSTISMMNQIADTAEMAMRIGWSKRRLRQSR